MAIKTPNTQEYAVSEETFYTVQRRKTPGSGAWQTVKGSTKIYYGDEVRIKVNSLPAALKTNNNFETFSESAWLKISISRDSIEPYIYKYIPEQTSGHATDISESRNKEFIFTLTETDFKKAGTTHPAADYDSQNSYVNNSEWNNPNPDQQLGLFNRILTGNYKLHIELHRYNTISNPWLYGATIFAGLGMMAIDVFLKVIDEEYEMSDWNSLLNSSAVVRQDFKYEIRNITLGLDYKRDFLPEVEFRQVWDSTNQVITASNTALTPTDLGNDKFLVRPEGAASDSNLLRTQFRVKLYTRKAYSGYTGGMTVTVSDKTGVLSCQGNNYIQGFRYKAPGESTISNVTNPARFSGNDIGVYSGWHDLKGSGKFELTLVDSTGAENKKTFQVNSSDYTATLHEVRKPSVDKGDIVVERADSQRSHNVPADTRTYMYVHGTAENHGIEPDYDSTYSVLTVTAAFKRYGSDTWSPEHTLTNGGLGWTFFDDDYNAGTPFNTDEGYSVRITISDGYGNSRTKSFVFASPAVSAPDMATVFEANASQAGLRELDFKWYAKFMAGINAVKLTPNSNKVNLIASIIDTADKIRAGFYYTDGATASTHFYLGEIEDGDIKDRQEFYPAGTNIKDIFLIVIGENDKAMVFIIGGNGTESHMLYKSSNEWHWATG